MRPDLARGLGLSESERSFRVTECFRLKQPPIGEGAPMNPDARGESVGAVDDTKRSIRQSAAQRPSVVERRRWHGILGSGHRGWRKAANSCATSPPPRLNGDRCPPIQYESAVGKWRTQAIHAGVSKPYRLLPGALVMLVFLEPGLARGCNPRSRDTKKISPPERRLMVRTSLASAAFSPLL